MADLVISDGEIDAFKILRVVDVAKIIRSSTGSYKANSALVVIDFLYRHGFAQLPTTFYETHLLHSIPGDFFSAFRHPNAEI